MLKKKSHGQVLFFVEFTPRQCLPPRRRDVRRDTLNAAETDAETKDSVTLLVCPISAGTHAETTSYATPVIAVTSDHQ